AAYRLLRAALLGRKGLRRTSSTTRPFSVVGPPSRRRYAPSRRDSPLTRTLARSGSGLAMHYRLLADPGPTPDAARGLSRPRGAGGHRRHRMAFVRPCEHRIMTGPDVGRIEGPYRPGSV